MKAPQILGLAGASLLWCSVPRTTSAQGLGGKWSGLMDVDLKLAGDSVIVNRRSRVTLDLRNVGDSVMGTWQQAEREPVEVRGLVSGNALELRATIVEEGFWVDGRRTDGPVQYLWHGIIAGAEIRGTVATNPGNPARPFRWEVRSTPR